MAFTYDHPLRETITFSAVAATGGIARAIRRPPGMRFARIQEYVAYPTVATTGTTVAPLMNIGDGAAEPAKFASLRLGPATAWAVGISYGTRDHDGRVAAYKHVIDMDTAGPAGVALSELDVTFVAGTGTAGGPLEVNLIVDWWA